MISSSLHISICSPLPGHTQPLRPTPKRHCGGQPSLGPWQALEHQLVLLHTQVNSYQAVATMAEMFNEHQIHGGGMCGRGRFKTKNKAWLVYGLAKVPCGGRASVSNLTVCSAIRAATANAIGMNSKQPK